MAELKTKPTKESARKFLKTISLKQKQEDGLKILELMQKITGEKPVMWGESIVGFGKYHYKSERSSQEGDWPLIAFSPRKQNLTLYIMAGNIKSDPLFKKLGSHTKSKGCLYIKRLKNIDEKTLEKLIEKSYIYSKKTLG